MNNILFINACPRQNSRTLELARSVLEKMNGQVLEVRLFEGEPLHLTRERLQQREQLVASNSLNESVLYMRHLQYNSSASFWI